MKLDGQLVCLSQQTRILNWTLVGASTFGYREAGGMQHLCEYFKITLVSLEATHFREWNVGRQMVRWRETQTLPTSHIIQWVWTNKRDSGEQIVQEWVTTKGCTGWAVSQSKRESSPQQNTAFSQKWGWEATIELQSFDLWYWTPKTQTLVFAKWWESRSSGLGGVNASHVNTSVVWLI